MSLSPGNAEPLHQYMLGVTGFTARALESPGRQHTACAPGVCPGSKEGNGILTVPGETSARSLGEGIMLLLSTCQTAPRHCVLLSPSRKGSVKLEPSLAEIPQNGWSQSHVRRS